MWVPFERARPAILQLALNKGYNADEARDATGKWTARYDSDFKQIILRADEGTDVSSYPKSIKIKTGTDRPSVYIDMYPDKANGGVNETGIKRYKALRRSAAKAGHSIVTEQPFDVSKGPTGKGRFLTEEQGHEFFGIDKDVAKAFDPTKHPRGQPNNAGEFGPGGGSTSVASSAPKPIDQVQWSATMPKPKVPNAKNGGPPVVDEGDKGDPVDAFLSMPTGHPKFSDNSINWGHDMMGHHEKEYEALTDYASSAYHQINNTLRGAPVSEDEDYFSPKELTSCINNLDGALKDAPTLLAPVDVYRGFASDHPWKPGEVVTDAGFMSTSLKPAIAAGSFATHDGTLMHITVPAGTKAVPMSLLAGNGFNDGEAELLLPRGSGIKIISSDDPRGDGSGLQGEVEDGRTFSPNSQRIIEAVYVPPASAPAPYKTPKKVKPIGAPAYNPDDPNGTLAALQQKKMDYLHALHEKMAAEDLAAMSKSASKSDPARFLWTDADVTITPPHPFVDQDHPLGPRPLLTLDIQKSNPYHDDKGRFTSEGSVNSRIASTAANSPEGFTVNPFTGKSATSGYAVAIDNKLSRDVTAAGPTPQAKAKFLADIKDYLGQVRAAAKKNPLIHMGGWKDSETGKYVLDHSEVHPNTPQGRATALQLGRDRDQKSIFDLDKLEEIPTGGTGGDVFTKSGIVWTWL